jgi:hypothetical protein
MLQEEQRRITQRLAAESDSSQPAQRGQNEPDSMLPLVVVGALIVSTASLE